MPEKISRVEKEAEDLCRRVYRETKSFYNSIDLKDDPGFQILMGPPFAEPEVLFIGYQPGRGTLTMQQERDQGAEDRWPSDCEYATKPYRLANNLRFMFGREFVRHCVGLNAIFVRSPNLDAYRRSVKPKLRITIEEFCLPLVIQMVQAIRPRAIVVMGIETLNLFGDSCPALSNSKKRVLVRTGSLAERMAIGTLHLSGAYISTSDRAAITGFIKGFLAGEKSQND